MTENKPRQYYKTSKRYMDHEREMALINAFARDPELKYFVGAASGSGVAWIGKILDSSSVATSDSSTTADSGSWSPTGGQVVGWTWLLGPFNPAIVAKTAELIAAARERDSAATIGNFAGLPLGEIMVIGGTGFAGSCMAILFLKAMFGTGGISEVMKGIGEIVPG